VLTVPKGASESEIKQRESAEAAAAAGLVRDLGSAAVRR
jgi:hypothetical protein